MRTNYAEEACKTSTDAARKPVAVEFPIADIIIGNRQRRDLGDIEVLAASIEDIGSPHPVLTHAAARTHFGRAELFARQHREGWDGHGD